MIFGQKTEILPNFKFSIFLRLRFAQLHKMVNNNANYHFYWLYTVQIYKRYNSKNVWFSDKKTEIVPKIKCSVFMKIEYAQLYMMVNSHGNYKSCWLFIIQEFLLTKLNSQNVWLSDKKLRFYPKLKIQFSWKYSMHNYIGW